MTSATSRPPESHALAYLSDEDLEAFPAQRTRRISGRPTATVA